MRGLDVTLVSDEATPQHARLGEAAGRRIGGWLEALGVELVLGAGVEAIGDHAVQLPGGATHTADLILMAAGVKPCAGLAENAGLDHQRRPDRRRRAHAHVGRPRLRGGRRRPRPQRRRRATAWRSSTGARRSTWARSPAAAIAGEDATWDVAPGFWSTIGEHTLKYVAWGDGFDDSRLVDTATAPSPSGTAAKGRRSACSPTSATRTTSTAASWSKARRRCHEGLRGRSRPRRGGADRGMHRRARGAGGRGEGRVRGAARARSLHRRHRAARPRRRRRISTCV